MAVFLITDEILLLVLRLVEPDITEVLSQGEAENIFSDVIGFVSPETQFKCGVDGGILVCIDISSDRKPCSKRKHVLWNGPVQLHIVWAK